jgi:hypothetical protein
MEPVCLETYPSFHNTMRNSVEVGLDPLERSIMLLFSSGESLV